MDEAGAIKYVPPKCEKCGRQVVNFNSMCIPCANEVVNNKQAEPVAHYGIIDPDYARVFTQARCIAWQYGYACVMQGSFTRDLDLLMVPWTDQAKENREQLLKLIAMACDLRFSDGKKDVIQSKADFTEQPHGRTSCSLHFPKFGDRRWIDVSFFPVQTAPAVAQEPADVVRELVEALKCVVGWSQSPNRYIPDTCIDQVKAALAKAKEHGL